MKLIHVAVALAIVGVAGSATGAPSHVRDDESVFTVDLLEPLGHVYFLTCDNGYDILDCERPTVWEQSNKLRGLQTFKREVEGVLFQPDILLIG